MIRGASGQSVDIRVLSSNNLSTFNDVAINAQSPFIRSIDAQNVTLSIGESVEFTVNFSEAIELSGVNPSLALSNGGVAQYVSGSPSSSFLFRYTALESDASSDDLDVVTFNAAGSSLTSLSGNGLASVALGNVNPVSSRYDIAIDSERPEGVISVDAVSLNAGQSANVTVTFVEPVSNPWSAITVNNGVLSPLVTDETSTPRTVWKGVFTPSLGVEDPASTLVLDNALVSDDAGNVGTTLSISNTVEIDTQGPIASISSSVVANGNRVFTLDFGESVSGFDPSDIVTSNGVKVAGSFTEVEAGRVYTIEVAPPSDAAAARQVM